MKSVISNLFYFFNWILYQ